MRGIALTETNELVLSDSLPEPEVGPGQVLIRMTAGGVCGSDLSSIASGVERPYYPWAIGHEGGGIVVERAEDVSGIEIGDLVVIEPNFACLACEWCLRGRTKLCVNRVVIGSHLPGIFAEYVAVPAEFVWRLPADTPLEVIAAFEPAVVAYSAVEHQLGRGPRSALVVGAGSQGILATQRLVDAGLVPAVIEPNAANFETAVRIGARGLNDPDEVFDLIVETSGAGAGLQSAIAHVGRESTLTLIGQTSSSVALATRTLVQNEVRIQGHIIYDHPVDFATMRDRVAADDFHPQGVRERVGPAQAVTDILNARNLGGKIVIDFSDWGRA